MKKALKFRQFYEGKFHFWGFVHKENVTAFVSPISPQEPSDQFTGLTDQHGNEIYERDILKDPTTGKEVVVEYDEKLASYWPLHLFTWRRFTGVVGNTHENPDLLT